jgi:hypothetical protein
VEKDNKKPVKVRIVYTGTSISTAKCKFFKLSRLSSSKSASHSYRPSRSQPRVKIVTPNQTVRVGSTAQFPRVDPDKKPEMQVYRAFLEGFDGGRKSFKVGFMY